MNADWFYAKDDQRLGPVSEQELKGLATDGKLKPSDLVWRDGMPDWVEARTQAALFPPKVEPLNDDVAARRQFADIDDDRPSARERRRRYEDDEDRPSRRGRRDDDDYDRRPRRRDDDDYDRRPRRRDRDDDDDYDRPRRSKQKPGQVQSIAIMMLIGGITGILIALAWILFTGLACCFWPGVYYGIVIGILTIIRASNMLGSNDLGPPRTLAILQIICIVTPDPINCTLGIVSLVMLNDPHVQAYYRNKGFD